MSTLGIFYWLLIGLLVPIYWALPHHARNRLLLLASYALYASWDWRLLGLIALPTVLDYHLAQKISAAPAKPQKKRLVLISVSLSLAIFLLCRTQNFFIPQVNAMLGHMGLGSTSLTVLVPIGLSFYLFKSVSYVIDVYRGVLKKPIQPLERYALCLAFFPQLLSGPIDRPTRFSKELDEPRPFDAELFRWGAVLIVWGLFKKTVLADNLGILTAELAQPANLVSSWDTLLLLYANLFQLYADFSGYSDIAIGTGALLGFRTPENFHAPFLASRPSEIWRRWHISLSNWVRDYVFYYIAGHRSTGMRLYLGMMASMTVIALWHAFSIPFVAWGLYFGLAIWVEMAIIQFVFKNKRKEPSAVGRVFGIVLTFHIFVLGDVLPLATNVNHLMEILRALTKSFAFSEDTALIAKLVLFAAVPIFAGELVTEFGAKLIKPGVARLWAVRAACVLMLAGIFLLGGAERPFIYAGF